MQTGVETIRARVRADRRKGRRILVISAVLLVAVLYVVLAIDRVNHRIYNPWQVLKNMALYLRIYIVGKVLPPSKELADLAWEQASFSSQYFTHTAVFLMAAGGAVLSIAGAVYQSAMRNPMAVPTMLGVTSGVSLAQIWLVLQFGTAVYTLTWQRYLYCYGAAAVVLVVVLVSGKIAGGKKAFVADMLIAGAVVNQIVTFVTSHLRSNMDSDTLYVYEVFSEKAGYGVVSGTTYNGETNLLIFCAVSAVVLLPLVLMRFSYNGVSFSDEESRTFGVRPAVMRVYGLIAGAVLTAAAMIHISNIGTLALIIPHLCRYVFGADFRRVLKASALYGSLLLVVSWYATKFLYIGVYQVPVGSVVSFLAIPAMLWFTLSQRRGWE